MTHNFVYTNGPASLYQVSRRKLKEICLFLAQNKNQEFVLLHKTTAKLCIVDCFINKAFDYNIMNQHVFIKLLDTGLPAALSVSSIGSPTPFFATHYLPTSGHLSAAADSKIHLWTS